MFAIWCRERGRYYHPDGDVTAWADAMHWEDIGEAGYAADQLCERDDGLVIAALGRKTLCSTSSEATSPQESSR